MKSSSVRWELRPLGKFWNVIFGTALLHFLFLSSDYISLTSAMWEYPKNTSLTCIDFIHTIKAYRCFLFLLKFLFKKLCRHRYSNLQILHRIHTSILGLDHFCLHNFALDGSYPLPSTRGLSSGCLSHSLATRKQTHSLLWTTRLGVNCLACTPVIPGLLCSMALIVEFKS